VTPGQHDKRLMRRLYYALLAGIVLIWIGLSDGSQNVQLVGEAVCLSGLAWLGLGGWRVMRRCACRMKDGTDE